MSRIDLTRVTLLTELRTNAQRLWRSTDAGDLALAAVLDDAVDALARLDAVTAERDRAVEALRDSQEWLIDARRLIAELAGDLKDHYEPEKGWPPHIEAAANIDGDLEQMILDVRVVLAEQEKEQPS